MANKKIEIDHELLNDLYLNKKLSLKKLGEIFNCNAETISNRLKKLNIWLLLYF